MNTEPQMKSPKVSQPKTRRRGRGGLIFNLILLIAIIAVAVLFVQAEQKRRNIESDLRETSQLLEELKNSSENRGAQVAAEVLSRVRSHIDVPTEPEPTVATIIDVEQLRQTNAFYEQAKNGDHLIITEKRAILYDPERDIIVDVIPVSVQENQAPGAQTSPTASSPSPSPVDETSSPSPTGEPTDAL